LHKDWRNGDGRRMDLGNTIFGPGQRFDLKIKKISRDTIIIKL